MINYHSVDNCSGAMLANEINSQKGAAGKAIVVKADVSTVEGGMHLLRECIRQLGKPDILVLNAGLLGHRTLEQVDEKYYDLHFNTNVKGPLFLAKAVAETMSSGSSSTFCLTWLFDNY